MIMSRLLCLLSLLTLSGAAVSSQPRSTPQTAPPQQIVIHAGRLIADPARPAQGPSTIVVVGDRIQSVTAGLPAGSPGRPAGRPV
jgi:hypothetical protein